MFSMYVWHVHNVEILLKSFSGILGRLLRTFWNNCPIFICFWFVKLNQSKTNTEAAMLSSPLAANFIHSFMQRLFSVISKRLRSQTKVMLSKMLLKTKLKQNVYCLQKIHMFCIIVRVRRRWGEEEEEEGRREFQPRHTWIFLPFCVWPNMSKDSARIFTVGVNKPSTVKVLVGKQFQRLKNFQVEPYLPSVWRSWPPACNGLQWEVSEYRPSPVSQTGGIPGAKIRMETRWDSVQRLGLSRADCASIQNYFLIVEIKPKWET